MTRRCERKKQNDREQGVAGGKGECEHREEVKEWRAAHSMREYVLSQAYSMEYMADTELRHQRRWSEHAGQKDGY